MKDKAGELILKSTTLDIYETCLKHEDTWTSFDEELRKHTGNLLKGTHLKGEAFSYSLSSGWYPKANGIYILQVNLPLMKGVALFSSGKSKYTGRKPVFKGKISLDL